MAVPSTFLDIQTDVANKLRLTLADDSPKIKDWINQSYAEVAAETRCFQRNSNAAMTAGTNSYTLDTSILHLELVTVTQSGGTAWFPLVECQLDEILNFRAVGAAASGPARRYCLVGMNQLEVWPTPQAADTMNIYYSYTPTYLSADSDVPGIPEPFSSNLLGYGALVQGAELKRDIMVLGQYQSQYQASMLAFQKYLNRKSGSYPQSFPTWTRLNPYAPHDPSMDLGAWAAYH